MRSKGLTLLELLIALALIALLVSITFGSMQKLINAHKAELVQQQIINILNFARISAVTLKKTVTICPSTDQENCSTDWHQPWIIFVADGTTKKILHIVNINEAQLLTVTFANQGQWFSFQANGSSTSGTFQFCMSKQSWKITVNNTGRATVEEIKNC